MKPTFAKHKANRSAYYGTPRLWNDGIIDPADTRMVLALGIAASLNAPFAERKVGVFRM